MMVYISQITNTLHVLASFQFCHHQVYKIKKFITQNPLFYTPDDGTSLFYTPDDGRIEMMSKHVVY
jgi:hypothetical protein